MCIHMALNQKGPLHLGSVTCPSCGTGIDGEEWCNEERLQKSWHIRELSPDLYPGFEPPFDSGTTMNRVQAFSSTPVPMTEFIKLSPFSLPPIHSSLWGKKKIHISSLKPHWSHIQGEAVRDASSAGSSSNCPCWAAAPWLNNLPL